MSAELQASRRDATLILSLSNPDARNALHAGIYAAAVESLSTAERDQSIRAVILTGAGGSFCADASLRRLLENRVRNQNAQAEAIDLLNSCIEAIGACSKPVIAAVESVVTDAEFALALACDLIVAGESAQFMMSSSRVGLTPEGGASWFLAQALPRQLVTEMLLGGQPLPARRLHELGVVNRVVADGRVLDRALEWADHLANLPPGTTGRVKSLITEAQTNPLPRQFELEKQHFIESLFDRNAQEGIVAILEKRKPHYK